MSQQTENARPGRPSSFPGQETVPFLVKIPTEYRDMVREVAAKREEPLNVTVARFIEQGHKAAMRNRKRS